MKHLVRPALIITALSLAGQFLTALAQVVIAALFGAGSELDAFLAAATLPAYVVSVLIGTLSPVFVPVFLEYATRDDEHETWRVASGVMTLVAVTLTLLILVGLLFVKPILTLIAPGLSPESIALASRIALVTWPALLFTGLSQLLRGIYHAQQSFTRPAMAPVVGNLVYLGVLVLLATHWGIMGLAVAVTVSHFCQAVILGGILFKRGRFSPYFSLAHPGIRQVLRLMAPMLVTNALVWFTPVLERFLASSQPEGSISHLNYAFKLVLFLSTFISSGIATVLFPKMADEVARNNTEDMRDTVLTGVRYMWFIVAPCLALGLVLAGPAVEFLFYRGAFTEEDAITVTRLLQIYLLALIGICLGNVTGRAFYALKATRVLALLGFFQAIAYLVYTPLLTRHLGTIGIATGYALLFTLSISAHLLVLRYKLGGFGSTTYSSWLRTCISAMVAGGCTCLATRWVASSWLCLLVGGSVGAASYMATLYILKSPEIHSTLSVVKRMLNPYLKPPVGKS